MSDGGFAGVLFAEPPERINPAAAVTTAGRV